LMDFKFITLKNNDLNITEVNYIAQ
jgi:hypothetical protein